MACSVISESGGTGRDGGWEMIEKSTVTEKVPSKDAVVKKCLVLCHIRVIKVVHTDGKQLVHGS